ncbi:MAG: hypothetical protein JSR39_06775 [Verrucomicrobia bacterium]|nr:hypothetical protein [Verrucomicrobiota bacterium]
MEKQRLFFGVQVEAPWPQQLPKGRILSEEVRHITVAFLGNGEFANLHSQLSTIPLPSFKIGVAAIADALVFLPPQTPRVVAASVQWLNGFNSLLDWQKQLVQWLLSLGYPMDKRPFFPHITLARAPFDPQAWKEAFHPLPFFAKALHLYESLGNLQYKPIWSYPLTPPFEELDHTADIAFLVRGSSMEELHLNAQIAMSFKHPALIRYFARTLCDSLDEIIIDLNRMITEIDSAEGSPFKAVSFHGQVKQTSEQILTWEMIIDV